MAKQRFKGALNTATVPLVSVLQTRTVIQPQLDINVRTSRNSNSTEEATDYSIPQVQYIENVLPTSEGYQSVGYSQVISGFGGTAFDQAITLRDENENNFLLSPAGGLSYVYSAATENWVAKTALALAAGSLITRAYVNGRTFICYEKLGIYEFSAATGLFSKQTLVGLTDAEVRGIGGSSNYLLAFTSITVHWSSLVSPLDFVPSLTTGAGFAIPQDVKARITAVLGISGGFIVYTAKNAVAAVYTSNTRSPFTFKEVSNAGGITSYEQVTSEQNSGPHYAWTTGGLQKITIQGAEAVSAEINDFIAGRMWEYFDTASKLLVQQYIAQEEFYVKLSFISSRWLVISYSTTAVAGVYNYAIVYDTILKRYGKFKLDHTDCFYYPYPKNSTSISYAELSPQTYGQLVGGYHQLVTSITSDPLSKASLGFLLANGTVKIAQMSYSKSTQHNAVLIIGKLQMVRASMITMQQLDIETVAPAANAVVPDYQVYVGASLTGRSPVSMQLMIKLADGVGYGKYAKRVTGVNLVAAITGTFALTSYIAEVTLDGDR